MGHLIAHECTGVHVLLRVYNLQASRCVFLLVMSRQGTANEYKMQRLLSCMRYAECSNIEAMGVGRSTMLRTLLFVLAKAAFGMHAEAGGRQ